MTTEQLPIERRIFLAYPFTEFYNNGKIDELTIDLAHIQNAIQEEGRYSVGYCSIFEEEKFKKENIGWDERYKLTAAKLKNCGIFLGYVPTSTLSSGRENEAISALEDFKMDLYFLVKSGINWKEYHPKLINYLSEKNISMPKVIEFSGSPRIELQDLLRTYEFIKK